LNDFRLQEDIGISSISAAAVARIAGTKNRPSTATSRIRNTMMLARASALTGLSPSTQARFLIPAFNLPIAVVGAYPAIFAAVFNPPANSLTRTFTVTSIDALVERGGKHLPGPMLYGQNEAIRLSVAQSAEHGCSYQPRLTPHRVLLH
jgi:hypothetical protein